jgi:hypothetical protein
MNASPPKNAKIVHDRTREYVQYITSLKLCNKRKMYSILRNQKKDNCDNYIFPRFGGITHSQMCIVHSLCKKKS